MQKYVKENALKRLKSAQGHLDHVIKQVEEEKYCIDILQQSLAVQAALRAIDNIILKGVLCPNLTLYLILASASPSILSMPGRALPLVRS